MVKNIGHHLCDTISQDHALFDSILESDRRYFEAGAQHIDVEGAKISFIPSLPSVPAAFCAHIIGRSFSRDYGAWLEQIEAEFSQLGAAQARIYCHPLPAKMKIAASKRGFKCSAEYALALTDPATSHKPPPRNLELIKVVSPRDWDEKLRFHNKNNDHPDGRVSRPRDWVAFERIKAESGYMRPYLVRTPDDVVGAFSVSCINEIVRIKNISTDRMHRNRGVATAILLWIQRYAIQHQYTTVCLISLRG